MQLRIIDGRVEIELEWLEKLLAFYFSNTLSFPLSHIQRVSTAEPLAKWWEIRAPGTFIPGVIKAGTYYVSGGKEFWYLTKDKDYLVLELKEDEYQRAIVNIDFSEMWCERIQQELNN